MRAISFTRDHRKSPPDRHWSRYPFHLISSSLSPSPLNPKLHFTDLHLSSLSHFSRTSIRAPSIPDLIPTSSPYGANSSPHSPFTTRYLSSPHIQPHPPQLPSHPLNIFLKTPISVPFSNAAATRSLSPNCLFTPSAVLCVPSLILTSTLKREGRACSRRTRTPSPITVASEQCVIVGVM